MKDVVVCEKLRGVDKQTLNRRYPNGATHSRNRVSLAEQLMRRTLGTETSKYRQEKKSTEILKVAASEIGVAQIRNLVILLIESAGKLNRRG